MIAKQTTLTQSNRRDGGVVRRQWGYVIGVGLAAGALLMALALLSGRAAAPMAPVGESLPSDTTVRPTATNHNVPIRHTWSAYDGQARPAPVATQLLAQGWPGTTLMGSAYDGQTNYSPRLIAPSSAQGWPGATLTGSAYNGQSAQVARVAAPSSAQGWPGARLMGAAYDGQTNTSFRPAVPSVAVTMPMITGLVFDGVRYISALIAPRAPRAGRDYTVTALVYDGVTYRSAPIRVQGSAFR
jgi:hypothetical protein